MPKPAKKDTPLVVESVTRLTIAYVTGNRVETAQLPKLIASLHATLQQIELREVAPASAPHKPSSSVPVKVTDSITNAALISLIDGKPYKTLKRHLTAHGLTPEAYRNNYGLPHDYPMVSPDYAARRAVIAKANRLGHRPRYDK